MQNLNLGTLQKHRVNTLGLESEIIKANKMFYTLVKQKSHLSVFPFQLDAIVKQCRFWTGQPMIDIFRPTQPLDGRVVYCSKASTSLTSVSHLWAGIFSAVLGTTGLMH